MINLIPEEIKKRLNKIFYFKIVSISFLVLSVAILVFNLFLIPSLFFSISQRNSIKSELDKEKASLISYEDKVLELIEDADLKINIIKSSQDEKFTIFSFFSEIFSKRISGIKINDISYKNDNIREAFFTIKGSASSREDLLFFKNELEKSASFKSVDLPISNFIQKTNIQFSLLLTPN